MAEENIEVLEELVRASSLLSQEISFRSVIASLVEQSLDVTRADLAVLYLYPRDDHGSSGELKSSFQRGRYEVPRSFARESELVSFLEDCQEAVVLLSRRESPFLELLLHEEMESGIALPVFTPKAAIGILILNSRSPNHFGRLRLRFLDGLLRLAAGMLHNSRLYRELEDHARQIEELERYQENVFNSMTNLLVTTDPDGSIHYFNRAAAERLGLREEHLSHDFNTVFAKALTKAVKKNIEKVGETGNPILGVEGIYSAGDEAIDFSLNVSPLQGKRGKFEGLTLLFTDQTSENQLKEQMQVVSEERRVIKDMFARYLSNELVQDLVQRPELVKPGGDTKLATIFFADIRGYTSFTEGRNPEYIVKILNEYFNEAVEIVVNHKGYIDKFIGDCIMAAWGVPIEHHDEDATSAVSAAVEIQELVASTNRAFFKGEASQLRIGIGMHTGPLVAGHLGSVRRMDYTVIGDTVNVAARLEGVAEAGEVIITEDTRKLLVDDSFVLDQRDAVKVKGKSKPIPIYNVSGRSK
ncbi:MAG: adenylate/guanylate cyclase domain-containing protein [Alkalispirochaetaceae bacterium]